MSFQIAQHLQKLSTDKEFKKINSFPEDFECYLWVVVVSYYSIFYTANALLSKIDLKVGEKFAHRITEDCLLFYFLKNQKLAKKLLETYKETKSEVLNLMNINEKELLKEFQLKATELIATFNYRREKSREERRMTVQITRSFTFLASSDNLCNNLHNCYCCGVAFFP